MRNGASNGASANAGQSAKSGDTTAGASSIVVA